MMEDLTEEQISQVNEMTQTPGWGVVTTILEDLAIALQNKHFVGGPKPQDEYVKDVQFFRAIKTLIAISEKIKELHRELLTGSQKGSEDGKADAGQRRPSRKI